MASERDIKVGNLIKSKYTELLGIRSGNNWSEKLTASGYLHHRTQYVGTEVPNIKTYDSTPRVFMQKYESGLCGYLTPQDDEWGKLVPHTGYSGGEVRDGLSNKQQEKEILETLDAVTSMVFQSMIDSNFYQTLFNVVYDRDVLGVGYLYVMDGGEEGVIYRCLDPQECVISDSPLGLCEVFMRKTKMSAKDIVRLYGNKAELNITRRKVIASTGESSDVEVYEAVLPYDYLYDYGTGEPIILGNGNKFAYIVYIDNDQEIVDESGFREMPVSVVRRNADPDKIPYGVSLAEDCLEEFRKLNDLANQRQLMIQKNANPPMWIPNSLRGKFSAKPGKENYGPDGTDKPQPVITSLDSSSLLMDIQDLRQTLRGLIPVDLFETIMGSTDSRKTATEVNMKKNEAMILLSFQIGNLKRELLEPVFKRTARILIKNSKVINKKDIDENRRDSILSLVAKSRLELNSVFVRRLNAYLQNVGDDEIATALMNVTQIYPNSMDVIKMDEFLIKWFTGKGLLGSLINSEGEIKKVREERAKIQQEQLQAELNERNSKADANYARAMGGGM